MFVSSAGFSAHFSTLFHPITGEYDLVGKHPDAAHTVKSVTKYESAMEELKASVGPELELIESRVLGPTKEFQSVLKVIRKTMTKRDHKVCLIFHDICAIERLL
jgi:amphiphysin